MCRLPVPNAQAPADRYGREGGRERGGKEGEREREEEGAGERERERERD